MSFQHTLSRLLEENAGALAVLFLDETGEAVDVACDEFTPYQMKIVGAYVAIYLRQMAAVLADAGYGSPKFLHIEKEGLNLYASGLPDGYYLVLVQRRPALVGRARSTLEAARKAIADELFS